MRNRTADLLITSEMLYQLSYTSSEASGAWGRNRTTDTMIFSHVLYQLSYPGTKSVRSPTGSENKTQHLQESQGADCFFPAAPKGRLSIQ